MDTKKYLICTDLITCIDCERYKQEYLKALEEYNKSKSIKEKRNLYMRQQRLNRCYRVKIETSSGTDGWGAIPAKPTLDNKMGYGIN